MSKEYSYLGGFQVAGRLFDHVICTETDATFIRGLCEDGKAKFLYKVNSDAVAFELDVEITGIGKFGLGSKDGIWGYVPKDENYTNFFKDLISSDLLKLERLVFERIITRKLTKTKEKEST